jgi:hypothetical protein
MPHATLALNDRDLLSQCDVLTYRASGPGGQKRNKVESAVRLRHVPTGVTAIAEDSRSQLENRPLALRRLRIALALRLRQPVAVDVFRRPAEFAAVLQRGGRIAVNERNPIFPLIVATVLDVLDACAGRVSDSARLLDVSTHHLTRFLGDHPQVWQEANRIRQRHGQPPLRMT